MRELHLKRKSGDTRGLIGLTFDDGYEDFLNAAVPMLEKVGFSATVFVIAGMLGKENTWEHEGGRRSRLSLLDTDSVREVSERGMEVGSHTISHPRLSGLDSETLVREVSDSRQILSEILNEPVDGFCYPYGDLDIRAVRAAREAGYDFAVAVKKQVEGGLYDWPRIYVGERDSSFRFGAKLKLSPILAEWRRRPPG